MYKVKYVYSMIKELFNCLHGRYIMARHQDGTAAPLHSTSRPMLRRLRREGFAGISVGLKETKQAMGLEESTFPRLIKEGIFWSGLVIGAIEFMLIVAGLRNRPTGNWQWFRNLLET